jgi:hypothetical protein
VGMASAESRLPRSLASRIGPRVSKSLAAAKSHVSCAFSAAQASVCACWSEPGRDDVASHGGHCERWSGLLPEAKKAFRGTSRCGPVG